MDMDRLERPRIPHSGRSLRTSWFSGTQAKFPSNCIQPSLIVSTIPSMVRRLLIVAAYLTPALASVVDDVMLGSGNWSTLTPYQYGYSHISYSGVGHGFAVRLANARDPVQLAPKEK